MNQLGKTQLKVGMAVGAGLLLFVGTVFFLGGDKSIFSSTYNLKVAFDKVEGLAPGSVVRLSGYQVGNVNDIQFSEKSDQLIVNLKILRKFEDKITKNSTAGLRTQGALGDKYVYIEQGTTSDIHLKPGEFITTEPSTDIINTLTQRASELEKVFDILKELHKFTQALNQDGRSDKLMTNLVQASEQMSSAMAQFDSALKDLRGPDGKNLAKMGKALASITEKIDNGSGTLGGLVNDPSIHNKLKDLLGGSQRNEYMKSLIQKTIKDGK